MRKKLIIILMVVFIAGILSGTFIPKLLKRENLRSSSTDFLCNYLSLSKSQKERMESLNKSFYARIEKIRAQLDQRRAELSDLLGEPSSDQKKVRDKMSEIVSLQAQLQVETVNHLEEIRSILTPEQQVKFFSLIRRILHPERPPRGHIRRRF